jgi:hypothetical protein
MIGRNRYALLTVDTEALPKRASGDHVKRLMWGQHERGRAGVGEMTAIGKEFGAKHIFFVDMCGAYAGLSEVTEVIRWLDAAGQDVQLHTHPEYLPALFWNERKLRPRPRLANEYTDVNRAAVAIGYFADLLKNVTGKPVLAHRAGSFRWNATTLHALHQVGIPLSFNNSLLALEHRQCPYAEQATGPFLWSNGVVEIPVSEKSIFFGIGKGDHWVRLTFPESPFFRFRPWWGKMLLNACSGGPDFSVFLMHSWSLLYWNEQGHAEYRDDRRLEQYRRLLSHLTKDYDVITSQDCLDLIAAGKIRPTHTVDVEKTALPTKPVTVTSPVKLASK